MIEFHPLKPDAEEMPTWNPRGLKNLAKLAGVLALGVAGAVGMAWAMAATVVGIYAP